MFGVCLMFVSEFADVCEKTTVFFSLAWYLASLARCGVYSRAHVLQWVRTKCEVWKSVNVVQMETRWKQQNLATWSIDHLNRKKSSREWRCEQITHKCGSKKERPRKKTHVWNRMVLCLRHNQQSQKNQRHTIPEQSAAHKKSTQQNQITVSLARKTAF